MDVKDSLNLAGRNLLHCLNPEQNYLPYYKIHIDPDPEAEGRLIAWRLFYCPAENITRWWNAILRLEEATGFVIPPEIEAAMLENAQIFFDNPDHLCHYPIDSGRWDPIIARFEFELHSLRESLLTLVCLERYRGSRWAADKGRKMVRTLARMVPEGMKPWDLSVSERARRLGIEQGPTSADILSGGRFLQALVAFYRETGDAAALEVANRIAEVQLAEVFRPDGEYRAVHYANHTHSYFGTLYGLLRFGEVTGRHEYVDTVAATYRRSVRKMVRESGYTCHDIDKETGGDPASAADAATIALRLACHHGHGNLLDDVERIVRSRVLPSQIVECPPIRGVLPAKSEDGESYRYINAVSRAERTAPAATADAAEDLRECSIGAYGGIHPEIHGGKRPVTDVTGAAVHDLCEIYRHIAVSTPEGLRVNLHLTYEDDHVCITATRAAAARVAIVPKVPRNVWVRIPGWAPSESVRITAGGQRVEAARIGSFALVPAELSRGEIVVSYALPERRTVEETDGVAYRFTWRGDQITGVSPQASFLPFYPTARL